MLVAEVLDKMDREADEHLVRLSAVLSSASDSGMYASTGTCDDAIRFEASSVSLVKVSDDVTVL